MFKDPANIVVAVILIGFVMLIIGLKVNSDKMDRGEGAHKNKPENTAK